MNPSEFAPKWREHQLSVRASNVKNFLDLCALVGYLSPSEVNRTGQSFTFKKGVPTVRGQRRRANVWEKGDFASECAKQDTDLNSAYKQLLQYRGVLASPIVLIVSETRRVIFPNNSGGPERGMATT